MKKISVLGHEFIFIDNKIDKEDAKFYSEENTAKKKIFFLLLIMFFISLSANFKIMYKNTNYNLGEIATKNIYAPKNLVFRDEQAKDKIIAQIITSAEKQFIALPDAKNSSDEKLTLFFLRIEKERAKDEKFDLAAFQDETGIKISEEIRETLVNVSNNSYQTFKKEVFSILDEMYRDGIYKEENGSIKISNEAQEKLNKLPPLSKELISHFSFPSYIYDAEKTKEEIKEKVSQIKDPMVKIHSGDLIVKRGDILTAQTIRTLEALGFGSFKSNFMTLIFDITYLLIFLILFYSILVRFCIKEILTKSYYRSTLVLTVVTFLVFRFTNNDMSYLLPLDIATFILLITTNMKYSLVISWSFLFLLIPIYGYNLKFAFIHMVAIFAATYLIKKVRTRSEVVNVGVQLGILKVVLFMILTILLDDESQSKIIVGAEILASGLFTGMFTIAILPYFEKTFNLLTVFRLLELGDLSHPLLKRLAVEAPGTFNHSLMVATLAENACENLEIDPILCRVSAYYHDIGKIKRPLFYIENQFETVNEHDKLTPNMSALIIKAHTKEGNELGREYQLPKEIRDIMLQHHGTTTLTMFYNKAKVIDSSAKLEDFQYPGPKPQTKEAAIIMLADTIEAAVRSLEVKTATAIEELIRKLIKAKTDDNQLSDCDLTFREIESIIQSFVHTSTSIHHARIKYPEVPKVGGNNATRD